MSLDTPAAQSLEQKQTTERGAAEFHNEVWSLGGKGSVAEDDATQNKLPTLQKSELIGLNPSSQSANGSGSDVLLGALKEMPGQTEKLAQEAWEHPGQFIKNSAISLGESAAIGVAMGMLIPSRGLAAGLATIAFTAPMAIGTVRRVDEAYDEGNKPGADANALSKSLASDLVHEGWDFALGSVGGFAGAHFGHVIATSDTVLGSFAQQAQRSTLRAENSAMFRLVTGESLNADTGTAIKTSWLLPKDSALSTRLAQATAEPKDFTIRMGSLHGHSYYSDGMGTPADIFAKAKADGMDFYAITDHNHLAARAGVGSGDPRAGDQAKVPIIASMPSEYASTLSDAAAATEPGKFVAIVGVEMGTIGHVGGGGHGGGGHGGGGHGDGAGPGGAGDGAGNESITGAADFASPQAESLTEAAGHDHAGHTHSLPEEFAHLQVPDNLPPPTVIRRVYEPDGSVIETKHVMPQETAAQAYREQMYLDAQKAAQPTLLAENKVELSPREQAIADAAERDAGHYSGINHVNVFEFPQMIIADRAGDTGPRAQGAIHYNDGDFNGLVKQIGDSPDTTGGLPVWQLNHPRYVADNNPNTPDNLRGRDYGTKSFPSHDAYLAAMDPRVHQVEVITGEALNPDPVSVMKPHDLGPINMAGYIDSGLHVSPTYGRDDHFALPGGRPAGTGIIADKLDKETLLNALRNRQTIATTSTQLLKGYMTANNNLMGSILDQNAVNDLNIAMNVGGKVDPAATYKVNLWADTNIGDGKLATMIQSKSLSGQDMLSAQGQVQFDQVHHTIGNKSAWYVEVQRTDPGTSNTDYMWTAPVWIEPKSGASHSLLTRALVGAGSSYLLGAGN